VDGQLVRGEIEAPGWVAGWWRGQMESWLMAASQWRGRRWAAVVVPMLLGGQLVLVAEAQIDACSWQSCPASPFGGHCREYLVLNRLTPLKSCWSAGDIGSQRLEFLVVERAVSIGLGGVLEEMESSLIRSGRRRFSEGTRPASG